MCAHTVRNKRVMMQLSVLEGAWRLIGAGHELAVEAVSCVCALMTGDGHVMHHAVSVLPRLLDKLADMLSTGCSNMQYAIAALVDSMVDIRPVSAKRFARAHCVECLVGMLEPGVPAVQEQAALALKQLLKLEEEEEEEEEAKVRDKSLVDITVELGAIGCLLDMVTSGHPSLMEAAGLCLRMFPQETIASTGSCLERLVYLAAQPQYDLVHSSCLTLAHLARDSVCQSDLMALHLLPILLSLLASNFLPNRAAALSVLANLLELSSCQEQLRLLKGIPLVVANLAAATAHRSLACLALRNAAILAPNKSAIKESGALPMLVSILKDGGDAEREHSAGALWHLAHDSGIKITLRELGVFVPLVALVKAGSRTQQAAALGCMWALAHGNANNKACLRSAGAITVVAALLKEHGLPLPVKEVAQGVMQCVRG